MKSRKYVVAALLAALAAPAARAQEAAPKLQEDPRAAKFKDVERGFFVGFEVGWLHFFQTPKANLPARPLASKGGGASNGALIGLNVGVDLGPLVAVSVFAQGANETASVDYGAFSVYAAGLDVRVSPLAIKDRNGWDRLFVYGHARAGYARTWPTGLFGDVDTLLAGGVGVEYFTRLRHFSVGVAADVEYATKAKVAGAAIYPTVRYTF